MLAERAPAPELEQTSRLFASVRGEELAIVFGSVARGSARVDSDIDVAVLGATCDVLALTAAIAHATGRDAHVVRLEDATIPMLDAIVTEGIAVYEGRPGAEGAWRARVLTALELDRPWYASSAMPGSRRSRSKAFRWSPKASSAPSSPSFRCVSTAYARSVRPTRWR